MVANFDDIVFDKIVRNVLDFPTILLCRAMMGVLGVIDPGVATKISIGHLSREEDL
jgi:hypothetical protein